MALAQLRTDERVGLGVAVMLHAALVAVLVLQPGKDEVPPLPERMTVSLTSEVSLASTAPDPVAESRAAIAPTLSDEPQAAPPIEQAQADPIPAPRPVATAPPPRPAPTRAAVQPRDQAKPQPPRRRPDRPVAQPSPARAAPPAKPATKPAGGSRIGADFLPGAGANTTTTETRVPASQIGASAKASLFSAISRRIRPKWEPPLGVDSEKLISKVVFNLNPDGTIRGTPQVVSQSGITDANRAQAQRHGELAVRAIIRAAPFDDLPAEYYEAWKRVGPLEFNWELAQ